MIVFALRLASLRSRHADRGCGRAGRRPSACWAWAGGEVRIVLETAAEGDLDAASKMASVEEGGFAGEFAELRGDIAVAKQELQDAREAYNLALSLTVSNPEMLQMKLDDLATVTP